MTAKKYDATACEPAEADFCLSSYRFDLPVERIAQSPAPERSGSRLMILHRDDDRLEEALFADLLRYLPENCLLVANNSRVVPARVTGKRPGGGRMEFLLLTPLPLLERRLVGEAAQALFKRQEEDSWASLPDGGRKEREEGEWRQAEAEGLLRPAKKFRVGDMVRLAPDLAVRVLERGGFGRCRVRLYWRGKLETVLERRGSLPLPPYIRRPNPVGASAEAGGEGAGGDGAAGFPNGHSRSEDAERYQTTYNRADKAGSVAAPTAGLHFTPGLREALERSGREWAEVTLYVGYGTFSPVRGADIREHSMHAEYAELPVRTLEALLRAKAEGRPVIAVGTTSARVLEGVAGLRPELFFPGRGASGGAAPEKEDPAGTAFAGWVSIFVYPGRPFHVVDGLITNFHLPESSLLMLVSALAGRECVLRAYQRAVESGFRFFSYGDAMLIL